MERNADYYKNLLKAIKFPKVNLPKIDFSDMEKPPRWVVVALAILIELILIFFILWLFDKRTIFENDYKATKYSGDYIKWGWVHMGTAMTFILAAISLFIAILSEYMAFSDKGRAFYNFYKKDNDY